MSPGRTGRRNEAESSAADSSAPESGAVGTRSTEPGGPALLEPAPWVDDANAAMLTDLYQLTMLQAYWREGRQDTAVFSLFVRRLPEGRNFLLACGLASVLRYLGSARFPSRGLDYLADQSEFEPDFIDWLADFRFELDVHAVLEGTPVFPDEPLLEVEGPMPQAQLAETFIMNQIHAQTVLASKAVRVVRAAQGRSVVDFGARRTHGTDAANKAARAFHVAGVAATSNVFAGWVYGIPITGTMAHSYIQSHRTEMDAFRRYAETYPDTILLVDTYDTLDGVHNVIRLAEELGHNFKVAGIRLDSGDLGELAQASRRLLDDAGLHEVQVFASGGLDEYEIADLVESGAPIDGFGVGTSMGVSKDAPSLDIAYKLTEYGGQGRLKLSPGKRILPGRKQVFRQEDGGRAQRDILARWDESHPGRPLLQPVMRGGHLVNPERLDLDAARQRAADELERLPAGILALGEPEAAYEVRISDALTAYQENVIEGLEERGVG